MKLLLKQHSQLHSGMFVNLQQYYHRSSMKPPFSAPKLNLFTLTFVFSLIFCFLPVLFSYSTVFATCLSCTVMLYQHIINSTW